jgi:hypothetical protein
MCGNTLMWFCWNKAENISFWPWGTKGSWFFITFRGCMCHMAIKKYIIIS